jgi:glycosyltransferase involved in cell wall biosynthesis
MINEAQCGVIIPAEDVKELKRAIEEYERMPREQLELIGRRGKDWLVRNRPYEKIAHDYMKVLMEGYQ